MPEPPLKTFWYVVTSVTAIVEHDFGSGVSVRNLTRFGAVDQSYQLTSFMASATQLLTPVPGDPNGFRFSEWFPTGFTPRFYGDVKDASIVGGFKHELESGLTYSIGSYFAPAAQPTP